MLTVPNVITIARMLLVPYIAACVIRGDYQLALILFCVAAVGDGVDGFIARRFHQASRLGAVLDPIADKLIVLTVALLLAWHAALPAWLAAAIALRDVVIVLGALAYHYVVGHLDMAPTRLSKLNTLLEFVALAGALAVAGGLAEAGLWLPLLFKVVFVTVVASGLDYVWTWGRRAVRARTGSPRRT